MNHLRHVYLVVAAGIALAACGGGGPAGSGDSGGKGGGAAGGKGGAGATSGTGGGGSGGAGMGGSATGTGGSGGAAGAAGAMAGTGGAGGATGGTGGGTGGGGGATGGTGGGAAGGGGATGGAAGAAGAAGTGGAAGAAGTGGTGGAAMSCGNGVMDPGETCDDHNRNVGDGCSALCQIEADWRCPTPGSPCILAGVCGDGLVARREACDDGNTQGGDGCAADCTSVDPGYNCGAPGRPCVPICGDGKRIASEGCDDGNTIDGDGCSALCQTEPGATCTGQAGGKSTCAKSVCGNGATEGNEACDCGTADTSFPIGCKGPNGAFFGDGSGCSRTCTKEPTCRSGGVTQACSTSCGNGSIETGEACDDGNTVSGDGCSKTCTIENGFACSVAVRNDGEPCQTGSGQCLHLPAVLRDFKNESVSGGHPDFFYMGATVANPVTIPGVQNQPDTFSFSKRYCVADAAGPAKMQSAVNRSWDLAASTLGTSGKPVFNAARANGTLSECQFIDWSNNGNGGHVPGYGSATAAGRPLNGLVYTIGESQGGSPMYRGLAPMVTSATTFAQWFVDSAYTGDAHAVKTLELAPTAGGQYQFLPNAHVVYGGFFPFDPPGQFPAAGGSSGPGAVRIVGTESLQCNIWPYWFSSAQFGAGNNCRGDQYLYPPSVDSTLYPNGRWLTAVQGWFHDFWFTTEIRTTFTYTGTFQLDVAATDDFYAFINGKLVVDLGGTHQRIPAHVALSGATGSATIVEGGRVDPTTGLAPACPATDPYTGLTTNVMTNSDGNGHLNCVTGDCDCRARTANLGLQLGRTYELAMFAANRHCPEYNLDVTLSAPGGTTSACQPRCGDAQRAGNEQCDCGDGASLSSDPWCRGMVNNDVTYGGCRTDCKLAAYCGDGLVTDREQCDFGAAYNTAGYGSTNGCTPSCRYPSICGDGVLDAWAGEQCDLGTANGTAGGACSLTCQIATP